MQDDIYLDHNATTPIAPEVADAMEPFIRDHFGNPSSNHALGRRAKEAVEDARAQVAALLGCHADEVIFCSGGSEANNAALKSVLLTERPRGRGVVTSTIEHPAIEAPLEFLARYSGAVVNRVPVDSEALIDLDAARETLGKHTVLLTVMHANNEVGTVQPIAELAEAAHRVRALVHSDAAQSVGKIPVNVDELGVDFLTVAGHKLYGPKGVGALYLRRGTPFEPLIHGANHELGRRAGTENVVLAVGLGAACALAQRELAQVGEMKKRRDLLEELLREGLPERISLHGHREKRLPNTLNIGIAGYLGTAVLANAKGLLASTGSACHAGEVRLSPVLTAMGIRPESGAGAIRLSLGRHTSEEDVRLAAERILVAIKTLP